MNHDLFPGSDVSCLVSHEINEVTDVHDLPPPNPEPPAHSPVYLSSTPLLSVSSLSLPLKCCKSLPVSCVCLSRAGAPRPGSPLDSVHEVPMPPLCSVPPRHGGHLGEAYDEMSVPSRGPLHLSSPMLSTPGVIAFVGWGCFEEGLCNLLFVF